MGVVLENPQGVPKSDTAARPDWKGFRPKRLGPEFNVWRRGIPSTWAALPELASEHSNSLLALVCVSGARMVLAETGSQLGLTLVPFWLHVASTFDTLGLAARVRLRFPFTVHSVSHRILSRRSPTTSVRMLCWDHASVAILTTTTTTTTTATATTTTTTKQDRA